MLPMIVQRNHITRHQEIQSLSTHVLSMSSMAPIGRLSTSRENLCFRIYKTVTGHNHVLPCHHHARPCLMDHIDSPSQ